MFQKILEKALAQKIAKLLVSFLPTVFHLVTSMSDLKVNLPSQILENFCSPARAHIWEVGEVRRPFIIIIIVFSLNALLKDLHLREAIVQKIPEFYEILS